MKNAMRDGSTCLLYVELGFSQECLREKKIVGTVKEGQLVNIGDLVFTTVLNMLSDIFLDWRKTVQMVELKALTRRSMEIAASPNLSDSYPILCKLDLHSRSPQKGIQVGGKKKSHLGAYYC